MAKTKQKGEANKDDSAPMVKAVRWHTTKPFDCFPTIEFEIDNDGGKLSCIYDPNPLFTVFYNSFGDVCSITEEELAKSAKRNGKSIEEMRVEYSEVSSRLVDVHFKHACRLIVQKIKPKLDNALWELGNEVLAKTVVDLDTDEPARSRLNDALNQLSREFNQERKRLWDTEGRGRPAVWTRAKLEQKIRSGINAFRKRKYRSPTLAELAEEIKMATPTLKKLLLRYELRYSTYKKET